jgi:kynurenine formamidase
LRTPAVGSAGQRGDHAAGDGFLWAAHQCDLQYSQIERLVNLGSLPAAGFKVSGFPLKIRRGSAGPARVVAILPD